MIPLGLILAGFFITVCAAILVCAAAFEGAIPRAAVNESWRQATNYLGTASWTYPTGGMERARMRLYQAGYRSEDAVGIYLLIRFTGAALVFAAMAPASVLGALAAAALFLRLSTRFVVWRIGVKARRVRAALPAALDLLALATEAGHTLEQGLVQAGEALRPLYPEFSVEASLAAVEMRAGTGRITALERLAERVPDEEVRKLVSVLTDVERFGVSLSASLRAHGQYLRIRMRQNVQEHARRLSVRLVIPVFLLIFPAIVLVTLGPAYLQMRGMFEMLAP